MTGQHQKPAEVTVVAGEEAAGVALLPAVATAGLEEAAGVARTAAKRAETAGATPAAALDWADKRWGGLFVCHHR